VIEIKIKGKVYTGSERGHANMGNEGMEEETAEGGKKRSTKLITNLVEPVLDKKKQKRGTNKEGEAKSIRSKNLGRFNTHTAPQRKRKLTERGEENKGVGHIVDPWPPEKPIKTGISL